ncbi:MAG: SPW repeat protein [Actinomycetota bacterium]|nr:SPW repeat protein [Actinomycetota bacterium]
MDRSQRDPDRAPGRWRQRMQGPAFTRFIGGVILVLGIWLTLASAMWSYGIAGDGDGFDARWNDVLVGIAVILSGLIRMAHPVRSATISMVSFMLGAWLVVAPLALSYGFGEDSTLATVNDIIVGAAIAVLSIFGHQRTANNEDN